MALIFDIPNGEYESGRSEFDGIDLCYGIADGSSGKVVRYFEDFARKYGIEKQQGYAAMATRFIHPHAIENYLEKLIAPTHNAVPDRNKPVWELVKDEVEQALAYFEGLLSEDTFGIVPLPVRVISDEGSEYYVWDMVFAKDLIKLATKTYDDIQRLRQFCDDPSCSPDLEQSLRWHLDAK